VCYGVPRNPTELRHALDTGKRVLIYVHDEAFQASDARSLIE
jgi:hypothetical protein